MKLCLVILFLLITDATLTAQKNALPDCRKTKTQSEQNECARIRFDYTDKQMKELYENILSTIRKNQSDVFKYKDSTLSRTFKDEEQMFVDAQEKWLEYRHANFLYWGSVFAGGSAMTAVMYNSEERLTLERIKELKEILKYNPK